VPPDWVSIHKLLIGVGRGGEILFVKGKELAVVKRGLEGTEEPGARVDLKGGNPGRRISFPLRQKIAEPKEGGRRPGMGGTSASC